MIRAFLSVGLCGACLGLGLVTVRIQAQNHARAAELDATKRRCDLIEAGNESLEFSINVLRSQVELEFTEQRGEEFEE